MTDVMRLLADIPPAAGDEVFETLARSAGVRVERIVSHGHASPEDFWYDQAEDEFVLVLRGAARLRFEGEAEVAALGPGDAVVIPARRRHRVEWTAPDEPTVWLAVFYPASAAAGD